MTRNTLRAIQLVEAYQEELEPTVNDLRNFAHIVSLQIGLTPSEFRKLIKETKL